MSFYTEIRAALVAEVLLGDAADYPMLHDNATLDNQTDTWLSINFTPIANRSATQGRTGEDEASGFMQVNVNAPQGHGSIDGLTLADSIASQFERGSTLTAADVTVVVEGATLAPSIFSEDGNTYITPITIDWRARRRRDPDSYTPPPVLCPGPSELCQPPQFSSALSFNGSSQYVDTTILMLPTDNSIHVNMVLRPEISTNDRIIFSALHSNSDDFRLATGQAGNLVVAADDGTIDQLDTGIPNDYNQWIVVSFGIANSEIYFRCESLGIDLTLPTSFDFPSITDGRTSFAQRAGGLGLFWKGSIAHASINGVGIPFNNVTPYDLTFATDEKTVVNYINDPVQTTQKVVHKEFEYGYFKAVRGDGAGRIDTGVTSDTVSSIKGRFVNGGQAGRRIMGCDDSSSFRITRKTSGLLKAEIGSGAVDNIPTSFGDEFTIEIQSSGDIYFNSVLYGNAGDVFIGDGTSTAGFFDGQGNTGVSPADIIILQAWVNGNEIDIHDTSKHVGTVSEHRLIDQS